MAGRTLTINGRRYEENDVLEPWIKRKQEAIKERKDYLPQVKINRKFAVGKQHLNLNIRDGRVIEVTRRNNVELVSSDILAPYIQTVIGRLSGNDYKSTFLVSQDNNVAEDIAKQLNMAFAWGWDNEWMGDHVILRLLRHLAIDGTCAIRCRYDRRFGEIIGEFPFVGGAPIFDDDERMKYMAENYGSPDVDLRPVREGKVHWEFLSFENLLWPPGYDDPSEFPWEMIVRPVDVKDLKDRYGKLADGIEEEDIESPGSISSGLGATANEESHKLKGKALTYTGYLRPCADYPEGQTVVFTETNLLDVREGLPYPDHPAGPRSGVHYFRWQVIPGRFPGRSFIEAGIDPQKVFNKRLTQINAIIDRGLPKVFIEEQSVSRPKTGEPLETIEVRPGSPLPKVEMGVQPGVWMLQDVKLHEENVEKSLGLASVTRGSPPQGVSAYSALALLAEMDALKLDPIANDIRLVMVDLSWDTMEAMRSWPADKHILIAGPEGRLQSFAFNANIIPPRYLVKPPRGGALPRSQAAELQKINDIWQASGGQLPLTWYIESLNAGKPQDLPPSIGDSHAHKAELENIAMTTALQPIPVAPYDDDARHAEIHRAFQIPLRHMADLGDQEAAQQVAILDAHIIEHERQASMQQQPQLGQPLQSPQQGASAPQRPPSGIPEIPGLNLPGPGIPGISG